MFHDQGVLVKSSVFAEQAYDLIESCDAFTV